MPIYEYECKHCEETYDDVFAHIHEDVPCPDCGAAMLRLISPVNFNMGVPVYGYYDENLGQYIGSNREKREVMRRQGVTPKGDTPKPEGDAWV